MKLSDISILRLNPLHIPTSRQSMNACRAFKFRVLTLDFSNYIPQVSRVSLATHMHGSC